MTRTLSLPQAQGTSIEWTHRPETKGETWTGGVFGCSKVSPGCTNCYAMRMAARQAWMARRAREKGREPSPAQRAYEKVVARKRNGDPRPQWNNEIVLVPEALRDPMRWREPRTVFVSSMSDLFHEDVSFSWLHRVHMVIACTPRHRYLVLTKRPRRAQAFHEAMTGIPATEFCETLKLMRRGSTMGETSIDEECLVDGKWRLPNVEMGTSVESADYLGRMLELAAVPAAGYFVSFEPIVGDLGDIRPGLRALVDAAGGNPRRVQAIFGGESGPGARPLDLGALHLANDMAREVGVAVFNKQLGARPAISGVEYAASLPVGIEREHGRDVCPECDSAPHELKLASKKGGDPEEWPEWARVREFPEVPGFTTTSKEAE